MCVFKLMNDWIERNEQETEGKRVLGYEKRNKRVWEAKRKGN